MYFRPLETEANTQKTEILFTKYCLIGSMDCLFKWEGPIDIVRQMPDEATDKTERTFCISFSPVRSVISISKNIILFNKKTDIQNTMNLMVGQPTKEALKTCLYVLNKQDQVNYANSTFILKNLLISRGCQNGSIGQSGPGGQGGSG